MLPSLAPNDIVLAKKPSNQRQLMPGAIVIFHDAQRDLLLIKRIESVSESEVVVSGDNPAESMPAVSLSHAQIIGIAQSVARP